LYAVSRPCGHGAWHDRAAWLSAPAVVPYPALAPGPYRPFFHRHDGWLWGYARIRAAHTVAGPLGHYGLHTRLATQPVRARDRAPSGGAATVRGHAVTRTHCDPERNATTPLAAPTTPRPTRWCGGSRALRGGLLREPGTVFPLVSYGLYILAGRGAGLPGN